MLTPSSPERRETPSPDRALILAQLERILASPVFRRAERLGQFLRFIVDRSVDGKLDDLKETVVGVEVYGRSPGYDPKLSPIVRTEARRLRAKLLEYEKTCGLGDLVVVRLPTGGYVPAFEIRPAPVPSSAAAEPPQALATSGVRSTRWLMIGSAVAGAGAVIIGLATLAVSLRHPDDPYQDATVTPFTSYNGFEFDPSLSPDGRRVAFVWDGGENQFDLYLKAIGDETPRRLTRSPAEDLNPVWSPDGKQIAFLRSWSDQRKQVIIIPATGGKERIVADIHPANSSWMADASLTEHPPGPAWSPDGRYLAAADRCGTDADTRDCIYLISLDSAERRKITSPQEGTLGDSTPRFSPDGANLAVIRTSSARRVSDIFIQPLTGGPARQLTNDHKTVSDLIWVGEEILFSSNRAGANILWRIPAAGGVPVRVPATGLHVSQITASQDGHRVIYVDSFRNTNVWRANLVTPDGGGQDRVKIIASSRKNDSAQYSPDGARICFVSDRTGTPQIWVANADGSRPVALTSLAPATPVGTPRWSPDSRKILFDSTYNGHSAIFEIAASGGSTKLLSDEPGDSMIPSWSHDGRFFYFVWRQGASAGLWKKPEAGGKAKLVVPDDRWDALESPDGAAIYFSPADTGLWKMSAGGDRAVTLPELKDVSTSRHFAVTVQGIYFVDLKSKPVTVEFFDFSSRRVRGILTIGKPLEVETPSLSVSPDGRWLLYSQVDDEGSDLMMLQSR